MGKSCEKSKKSRDRLLKKLKKLRAALDQVPDCRVKCCSCCCCPPRCKCVLVSNCCQTTPKSSRSCGPFPPSCTTLLPARSLAPCSSPTCCFPESCTKCTPCCCCYCFRSCCNNKSCQCCKRRCRCCCNKRRCLCNRSCRCCCNNRSCRCCRCRPSCCCRKRVCGSLCCCCKSLCVPRCNSDTVLTRRRTGRQLRCSKSVELRGGVLYRGCDCCKKNGLQDRCLRYCCINNPRCRTNPPSCHCSRFSCGRHLVKPKKCYTCCMCCPPRIPCIPMVCCCCRCQTERACQCRPSTSEVQCCCCPPPEPICCCPPPEPICCCQPPPPEPPCCCQPPPEPVCCCQSPPKLCSCSSTPQKSSVCCCHSPPCPSPCSSSYHDTEIASNPCCCQNGGQCICHQHGGVCCCANSANEAKTYAIDYT